MGHDGKKPNNESNIYMRVVQGQWNVLGCVLLACVSTLVNANQTKRCVLDVATWVL